MPKRDDIQHSVLVVSASESFNEIVKKSLPPGDILSTDFQKSSILARRRILERYYDLVLINAPLQDETGLEVAFDVAEQSRASVLLVVPKDVFEEVAEQVADIGVLAIAKPFTLRRMDKAIRFLLATQNKMHALEKKIQKAEEKLEELKIVNQAKFLLIEKKHMTEDEAHRYIGKQAMDQGISRKRASERILEAENP